MLQKIIASIIMFALLLPGVANAYTLQDQAQAETMLGKYSKYAPALEEAFPKISREKLEEIHANLSVSQSSSTGDLAAFINYALISIELELEERNNALPEKNISEEDASKVETQVMKFQENMESEMSSFLDAVVVGWNNNTRYKETGDLKMMLDMALEDFMQLEGQLNISDYSSETQVLDGEFTGDVEASYSSAMSSIFDDDGVVEDSFSLSTTANMIVKDGAVYVKLDNLDMESTSTDEYYAIDLEPFTNKLQALAQNNTYLEIPAEESTSYLETFSINQATQDMKAQMENAFGSPLLEAQSHSDMGYSMIPTKHFCDIGKKLSGVFDPFAGEDCTQSQYESMLKDFAASGTNIYMTLGNTNTLSISDIDTLDAYNLDMSWNTSGITEISGAVRDTREHADFTFIPNQSFTASYGGIGADAELNIAIDRNGNVSSGNASITTSNDDFNLTGVYDNKHLSLTMNGSDGDDNFACEFTGPLRSDYMDISGGCDIHTADLSYMIDGAESMRIDTGISYDGRNSKNNMDLSLNIDINQANYINFEVTNTGTRRAVREREIIIPTKVKDIEEFFTEIYEEMYSEYNY